MNRYLFKVFYLGNGFNGFQRQPNNNAVENYIESVFQELGYIDSFNENNYKSASRTDKGVNALENMFQCDMTKEPNLYSVNKLLNNQIQVWSFAPVNNNYCLRPLKGKTYQYYLFEQSKSVIDRFDRVYEYIGVHDFKNFTKKDKIPRTTISDIWDIKYTVDSNNIVVQISGDHFGWQHIRRMMGFLTDRRYYHLHPGELLDEMKFVPLHVLPGEFLVLKKIYLHNPVNWTDVKNVAPYERVLDNLRVQRLQIQTHEEILHTFLSGNSESIDKS